MTHDKIKAAARRRMAQTGETYSAARAAVIREHKAAQHVDLSSPTADGAGFGQVKMDLTRHAHDVREQLTHLSGVAEIERRFAELAMPQAMRVTAEMLAAADVSALTARTAEMLAAADVSALTARTAEMLAEVARAAGAADSPA